MSDMLALDVQDIKDPSKIEVEFFHTIQYVIPNVILIS